MENNLLENFITAIVQNNAIWLLQADDGLFAMLEGVDDQAYLPVWSTDEVAKQAIKDEWENYTVQEMDMKRRYKDRVADLSDVKRSSSQISKQNVNILNLLNKLILDFKLSIFYI